MGGKQSRLDRRCHKNSYGYPSMSSPSPYSSFSGNFVGDHRSSELQSKYSRIGDDYQSLDRVFYCFIIAARVTEALAEAGLESSNLIIGIDFTKSNEWTGSQSFHHKSLHHLGDSPNPYQQAISIIGRTLSAFDEDNLIPCFGFGDKTTHDQDVFSFYQDHRPCNGFEEVLTRYRELVPHIHLAGPTSFAPIIETAIGIVDKSGGLYHVLVIIADGQVTRSADKADGQLSPQEQSTINSIVKASEYPLSIVFVGVGDGPWDMMHKFDDNIPSRAFDNLQFVNFTEIMLKNIPTSKMETEFSLGALMEIPSQFKATLDLHLLSCQRGAPERFPLSPPLGNSSLNACPRYWRSRSSRNEQRTGIHHAPSSGHSSQNRNCPVHVWSKKDLAFGCGHGTCNDCGKDLTLCPI